MTITAALACHLTSILLLAGPVHALDPNKRLTHTHTSWRIQDGSVSAGMFSVVQTSDGFLWFTSVSQGMYRVDGIRFVPWTLPVDGRTIDHIVSVHSDRAGGLWAERATLIVGKPVVWSEVAVGTEVELRVSGSAAYMTDDEPSWWLRKFAPKA